MSDQPTEQRNSRVSPFWRRIITRIILLLLFLGVSFCAWLAAYYYRYSPVVPQKEVVVIIPKGASLQTISNILGEAGLIKDDIRFRIIGRLSGYGRRLQAGEFALPTGIRPIDVLRTLATARSILHRLTIPEGYTAEAIGELLGREGWCDPRSFANLVSDQALIRKLGFTEIHHLEGYLFPDTYWLPRDFHGAGNVVRLLTDRFKEVWAELAAELPDTAEQKKVVILAAMIEKEAAQASERPLIAGVFYNRLQLGMRLQSDPTVLYGRPAKEGPLTRLDLRTPTPHNTYVISGLPAGPICNPGKGSLYAALHPETTKHLYFVAKNDGSHHFSETLAEHNRAVQKYQRKKSAENGK